MSQRIKCYNNSYWQLCYTYFQLLKLILYNIDNKFQILSNLRITIYRGMWTYDYKHHKVLIDLDLLKLSSHPLSEPHDPNYCFFKLLSISIIFNLLIYFKNWPILSPPGFSNLFIIFLKIKVIGMTLVNNIIYSTYIWQLLYARQWI